MSKKILPLLLALCFIAPLAACNSGGGGGGTGTTPSGSPSPSPTGSP
ncbi:MAG: hypothetical protein Cpurp_13555 [Chlorogloea purpurea SAG 13.99]|nr:hypothetical protein [Chlorogloea purpurea SAG 13.99]